MSKYVNYIKPVEVQSAQGMVARVYDQVKSDLGIVPEPFTLHSPAPEILAGVWGVFRESLLAGRVRRGLKEAVAAAVSESNRCLWCIDAHTIVLYATGESEAVNAILHHASDRLGDRDMQAIIEWASSTRTPDAPILVRPPFSSEATAEMIGTAVTFHYLNRMVNVLLSETNLPRTAWVKHAIKRTLGWLYSGSVHKVHLPGTSLGLLPEAELPTDLAWAKTSPNVAGAFARFAAAVERAGTMTLSPVVRTLVHNYVQRWKGEDPGLSRQWVERAVSDLANETKAAGRLALLTALAPYQVDESVIHAFLTYRPGDDALVGALAWASFTAARRVGTWLASPLPIKAAR